MDLNYYYLRINLNNMKAVPLLNVATFKLKSPKRFLTESFLEIPTHTIIGVDGSFRNNVGAWGIVFTEGCYEGAKLYGQQSEDIILPHFNKMIKCSTHIKISSNRAESQAILIALFICKWIQSFSANTSFEIITDSLGVANSIIKFEEWKQKNKYIKNHDLLHPIYLLYTRIQNIKIVHVHGHVGIFHIQDYPEFCSEKRWKANKEADKLAKKGLSIEYIDPQFRHLFHI